MILFNILTSYRFVLSVYSCFCFGIFCVYINLFSYQFLEYRIDYRTFFAISILFIITYLLLCLILSVCFLSHSFYLKINNFLNSIFFVCFWVTPAVLRAYFCIFTNELLLVVLWGEHRMPGIKPCLVHKGQAL